nr:major pollen allergen Art v 1-like [Aegilops tauschii subsp. strangulata]
MAFSGGQMLAAFTLGFLLMAFCAEARVCMSPSKFYKRSPCKNVRCTAACHKEHFKGGYCSSKKSIVGDELNEDNDDNRFRKPPKKKRCICTFPCGSKAPPPPSEPEVPEPPGEPVVPEPPSKDPKKKPPPPPYERGMPVPPSGEHKKKKLPPAADQ